MSQTPPGLYVPSSGDRLGALAVRE